MRYMRLLLISLLLPVLANAADVPILYTAPTECENGEPVGVGGCSALVEYRLSCSANSGAPYELPDIFWPAKPTHTVQLDPGTYFCVLSVRNSYAYSLWSNELQIDVESDPSRPKRILDFRTAN